MKNTIMTFVSSFSLILATSASAQVISLGRGNVSGAPVILAPLTNPISPVVGLSAAALVPALAPTFAPVPSAPSVPFLPIMPTVNALRPIHVMPIMPVSSPSDISFSTLRAHVAASIEGAPTQPVAAPRKLNRLFDGSKDETAQGDSENLGPVRSDRHHSLPEKDLESEIGAY